MKELITVCGVSYVVENLKTEINKMTFTVKDPIPEDVEAAFKDAKSLTVGEADGDGEVYGEYPDVDYESFTITAEGEIIIAMHILTKTEKQIRELQGTVAGHSESIAEHDEAIAGILFGGEL